MKTVRFTLLLGLTLLVVLSLAGCLLKSPGEPQALFTASPVEHVIPFTANFDGTLSYQPKGQIVSYQWNFGDGGAGSGPVTAHTYEEDGIFTARLTVIDEQGLSDSSSLTVYALNPPPTATFSYSPKSKMEDDYIVGASEWITFDASESIDDGDIVSYDWNFGDGETDSGNVVKHRYLWPGTYNVVLTLTDDDGGIANFIERVKILGGPPCPGDTCGDDSEGGSCQ
jgi:PKD repeat protein